MIQYRKANYLYLTKGMRKDKLDVIDMTKGLLLRSGGSPFYCAFMGIR